MGGVRGLIIDLNTLIILGDLVELIEMNIAENLALVRSSIEKDRVGTVPLDFLVRMSATLERLAMVDTLNIFFLTK